MKSFYNNISTVRKVYVPQDSNNSWDFFLRNYEKFEIYKKLISVFEFFGVFNSLISIGSMPSQVCFLLSLDEEGAITVV